MKKIRLNMATSLWGDGRQYLRQTFGGILPLTLIIFCSCANYGYQVPYDTEELATIREHDPHFSLPGENSVFSDLAGVRDNEKTEIACIDGLKVQRRFYGQPVDRIRDPDFDWGVLLSSGKHSILVRACWEPNGLIDKLPFAFPSTYCGDTLFRVTVEPDTAYVVRAEFSGNKAAWHPNVLAKVWVEAEQGTDNVPVRISEIAVVENFTDSYRGDCECGDYCNYSPREID